MGDISVWGAGKVGRQVFGLEAGVGTLYLALIKGAEPTAFMTGGELAEVSTSGTGYARQPIALNGTNFYEGDYGRIVCSTEINFPTATDDWGRVRSWALCTASTGGDVMFYGKFKAAKRIETGDIFRVPGGALKIMVRPGE